MANKSGRHKCPLCGSSLTREHYERVLHIDEGRRAELARAEQDLANRHRALADEHRRILAKAGAAAKKAELRLQNETKRLREELQEAKLAVAQSAKVSAHEKQQIARDAAERSAVRFESQIRRLEEDRDRAEQRRQREAEAWKRRIEELQRRTEARDRLHFGPEGEEELEAVLRRQFPGDDIERRGRGGDVIHAVLHGGKPCGKIVYECKRTMDWKLDYVRQLRRAMETHGTRWGLLVSRTLPPRQSGFCVVDGVIVITPYLAQHLVSILRGVIIDLARAQLSEEGKAAKTEEVYRYLRGDDFKNAVQAIAERIKELRTSLEREKASHEGWWRTREQDYSGIARHAAAVESRVHEILSVTPGAKSASVHALRP